MYCSNCNSLINGNEKFCTNCGKQIENKNKKIPKKNILIGIAILICILILGAFLLKNKKDDYSTTSSSDYISYNYSEGNIPKFIDGKYSDKQINSSKDALKSLEDIKELLNINDVSKEFSLEYEVTVDNITYYRYNQVYNNIPVLNQNIIISVDANGNILSFSGYYIPNINLNTNAKKSKNEIEEIVKKLLGSDTIISSNELSIKADYETQQLIYCVRASSEEKTVELLINANDGKIISEVDALNYYSYEGLGMDGETFTIDLEEYSYHSQGDEQVRYKFYDTNRNILISDYRNVGIVAANLASYVPGNSPAIVVTIANGNITAIDDDYKEFIQTAISAMGNYEKIYDYYKDILGRNSYDNLGSKIVIKLGVTNKTFSSKDLNNAAWSNLTNEMYIGNYYGKSFAASLDVLAHEFTHGVIAHTSQFSNTPRYLNKANETGALNEGYADILGALIEGKNWTMGENNVTARSLSNPTSYETAAIKGEKYYFPDGYLTDSLTLEKFL